MTYLHPNFLLPNRTAEELYHNIAALQPIIDYHNHLPPEEVSANVGFANLSEMWLGADHYKWRAMRAAGEPEELITGKDVDPLEKFHAWARTVPKTIRNPLHHWTHLELQRYFHIDQILSPSSAEEIWEIANAKIADSSFTTQKLCEDFDICVIGTTDDPTDSLEHHIAFASSEHKMKMFPTFRPDKAMLTADVIGWNRWTDRLAERSGETICSAASFLSALAKRHDFFHEQGCRLSDHGLENCPFIACTEEQADAIFSKLRSERSLNHEETEQWMTFILQHIARWNVQRDWTMQLHIGPIRNNSTRMFQALGPDRGYDSMLDEPVVRKTVAFFDHLDRENSVPKTILYHLNPSMLYPLATLMASYQGGAKAGKMQLGSGWWHVDTLHGMRTQIDVLSSVGLLSQFVGMLTDSRSFLSFPRHEYFRRLLCGIIGEEVEAGLIPDDHDLLTGLIENICFKNAQRYFNFPNLA